MEDVSRKFGEGLLEYLASIESVDEQLDGIPQGPDTPRETV
jgi:hypothetical protein